MRFTFRRNWILQTAVYAAAALVLAAIVWFAWIRAPRSFPQSAVVAVGDGESLTRIAAELKRRRIISSSFWFSNFVILYKHERRIIGGDYYFDKPVPVYEVARRLVEGEFNIEQVKTTIPEGANVREVGKVIAARYPDFDVAEFVRIASSSEGRLFPETYVFGANPKPDRVLSIMTGTFNRRVMKNAEVKAAVEAFGKPFDDVLAMASIIELEARQTKTRQTIAGILWRRIDKDMPLQVDVSFKYLLGKGTDEITMRDLATTSPYNTYVHKGLPPTPISNPGLDAIMAAVTPERTNYLYFLTDRNGKMHYATNYEDHAYNQTIYLK